MSQTLPPHVFSLMRARKYLSDPVQWCKGPGLLEQNGRQAMCIAVAILNRTGASDVNVAAFDAIRKTLKRRGVRPELYADITKWNDQRSTTHADVMSVLDETIARESCPAGHQEQAA